ncbi:MAG TPA: hypothetical protein VHY91_00780 [Pirellulales bacterium]|jgi:hypothetical protein|nr:hypothetical protein [Pirellulales bacterium]
MKRFFRILRWCLLGLLGIVGILLTVHGIRVAWADHRLNERIEALRAAGQPISLAELTRETIPPEKNAATYLRRAKEDAEAIETQVEAAYDAAPKADQDDFDKGRPTPAFVESMRAALAAYPEAIALIEEASNCPDYDPQLDFQADTASFLDAQLEQMQSCRNILRVCNYRLLVQLDEGRREEALQTCLMMFRLARLYDRGPLLVSYVPVFVVCGLAVRDTNFVLRSGPLPQSDYQALEAELTLFDLPAYLREAFRGERAFGLQMFDQWSSGVLAATARLMPWLKNDTCDYLDMMAACMKNVALPYSEWKRKMGIASPPDKVGVLTGMALEVMEATHDSMVRAEAQIRALQVLTALLEREQAGGAGVPALADLGLPADVTTDPFNGEPLKLKKLPAGWLVYSVGLNLKDDCGDLTDNRDVGVGPLPEPKATGDKEKPLDKAAE